MLASNMNSSIRLREGGREEETERKKDEVAIMIRNVTQLGCIPVALLVVIDLAAIWQTSFWIQGKSKLVLSDKDTSSTDTSKQAGL